MERESDYEKNIMVKKENLFEVAEEIFEKEGFNEDDIVLIDCDETIIPTWEKFLKGGDFRELPDDSKFFLESCKEKGIPLAIVTNMPRTDHYMNHLIPVFGYEHHFQNKILQKVEFPLTLCLGSLYKQSNKCLCEIAHWSMFNRGDNGRIAWIGNSLLDKYFSKHLYEVLKDFGFDEKYYFYKLRMIRSSLI